MRAPGSSGLAYTHTYLVAVLFSTTPLVIQTCCTGHGGDRCYWLLGLLAICPVVAPALA